MLSRISTSDGAKKGGRKDQGNHRKPPGGLDPVLEARIQSAPTQGLTPELITEILSQDSILNAIHNDLTKTGQVGYMEMWRLGLITPDRDTFYPPAAQPTRQETIRKLIQDPSYRFNLVEQIPLDKTAILNILGFQYPVWWSGGDLGDSGSQATRPFWENLPFANGSE